MCESYAIDYTLTSGKVPVQCAVSTTHFFVLSQGAAVESNPKKYLRGDRRNLCRAQRNKHKKLLRKRVV